jgi:hypothetical protein
MADLSTSDGFSFRENSKTTVADRGSDGWKDPNVRHVRERSRSVAHNHTLARVTGTHRNMKLLVAQIPALTSVTYQSSL